MSSIPIDVLRAFVAVVEARGFTRAAEKLGRSQPTISLQVKRLEELVQEPLFEKAQRFELTEVGVVCFDYGQRLLRLHDDMLDEASRRRASEAMLRIGVAGEFAGRLAPRLQGLGDGTKGGVRYEVTADDSLRIASAFRQNALDIAFFLGDEAEAQSGQRWRAPLRWFGKANAGSADEPLPLALAPRGSALHEAAVDALRSLGRRFEIVCMSADFAVLAGAVSAGLGLAPMIEGLAPEGLKPSSDKKLPPLPPMTLTLLARSPALAESGRRWVADAVAALEPL